MPNMKKTYRYQQQQNNLTAEQLRNIDESIRERARQIAIAGTESGNPVE
jgi:hypothetical protein